MATFVKGAKELREKTERIASRVESPGGASARLTEIFRSRIEQRFSSGGDGSWASLSAETVETKARKGLDPGILRATGALEAAMTGGQAQVTGQQIRYEPSGAAYYGVIVSARRPIIPRSDPELADDVVSALVDHIEAK